MIYIAGWLIMRTGMVLYCGIRKEKRRLQELLMNRGIIGTSEKRLQKKSMMRS